MTDKKRIEQIRKKVFLKLGAKRNLSMRMTFFGLSNRLNEQ